MSEAQLPASQRERSVNASLQNSVATLQWSCDSAQGKADALGWVDSRIEGFHRSFSVQESRGSRQYRHRPYGAYLPRTMRMAAQYAQENGEPTVLEGLLLLFAKMEWLVATRRYYWSPMSPVPQLLVTLVEAMGIDNEIHQNRPDVLSRLVARLPTWNPTRGTVHSAKELLVETVGDPVPVRVAQRPKDNPIPIDPDLHQEVFACHDADWWSRRAQHQVHENPEEPSLGMKLTISNGFVQYQMQERPLPLHQEDVLIGWKISSNFPTNLLRLLPAWISIRVVVLPEDE